jgi:hypothetical protein
VKRKGEARGAVQIVEEAVALLRTASAGTILTYLFGAVPFQVAFLYFLSEMMRNPFARERLPMESLVVALLFVWKRIWQAIFAAQLHQELAGRGFSRRALFRTVVVQTAVQPLRTVVLPVFFFALVPFAWAVAFFRNVGLFAALGDPNPGISARSQAVLWTRQNWGILGILFGAAFVLFLNLLVLFVLLPGLVRSFLGIEGDLARLGLLVLNRTTVALAVAIVWLAIDPILEAAYVLRCFYGASLQSGEDLQAAFRRAVAIAALLIVSIGLAPGRALAQNPEAPSQTIDPVRLERSIDEVIRRREFTWRSAPQEETNDKEREWPGWIQSALRSIRDGVDWIFDQIKKWFDSVAKNSRDATPKGERPPVILWSALIAVALVGGVVALFLRRRRDKTADVSAVEPIVNPVNLEDESVTADQLPESSWRALADEWLAKGDYRLAMRALYLAGLNFLGERGLVSIQRSKTGLDYRRELERRARATTGVRPEVATVFESNNALFERGWYGRHVVERAHIESFATGLDEIRRYAQR